MEYNLKQEGNISLGLEGESEGSWVLLDFGNIILHVFHPEILKYYKLDELYSIMPGEEYEFLFTDAPPNGATVIEYHCEPHPWMTGTVEITKSRF